MRRRPARVVLAASLAAALAACGREDGPRPAGPPPRPGPAAAPAARVADPLEPRLGPYPRSQFYLHHDLFLPADGPRCVPAQEAAFLRDADEVLGFVIREKARAYAVTMLSYHHVVNDVVEGIPVAVTY